MTTHEIVMWVAVGCVGLLSLRNLTAFALSAAWLCSQYYYLKTGGELGIYADISVIIAIFAKATIREGSATYPTMRYQMRRFWSAPTVCDKAIVSLFLFGVWPIYAGALNEYWTYWGAYYITMAQLMLAGSEALLGYYRSLRYHPPRLDGPNILQFAPAYSRRAHQNFGAEPNPSHGSITLLPAVGKEGHA